MFVAWLVRGDVVCRMGVVEISFFLLWGPGKLGI